MRVAGVFAHGAGQCDGWALGDPSILGLTELESVKFGSASFLRNATVFFSNLPKLKSIVFGSQSFFSILTAHFIGSVISGHSR